MLDDIDLTSRRASSSACSARPGCGKSTLLSLIAGLDKPTAGTVEVPRRAAGADVPGAGAATRGSPPARNVELALRLRGVGRARAPRARPQRLLDAGPARGRRRQAGARALRRHAPARRAGPRARPGGATVLLMDEPFAALDAITRDVLHEELDAHLDGDRAAPSSSSRTTCARRSGSASGSCCSRRGPAGSPGVAGRHPAAPPHRDPEVSPALRRDHRPTCDRRSPAMATDTHRAADVRSRPRTTTSPPGSTRSRRRSPHRAAPPGGRPGARSGPCSPPSAPCSSRGRSPTCSSSSRRTRCPARPTSGRPCSATIQDGSRLARGQPQPAARGGRLRDRRSSSAWRSGVALAAVAAAAPRVRPDHHRAAVAAVGRLGARRDHLVRADRRDDLRGHPARRGAVDRQRPARRHRPGAAAATCGSARCSAPAAGRGSGTCCCPPRCPASSAGSSRAGRSRGARSWPPSSSPTRRSSAPGSGSCSTSAGHQRHVAGLRGDRADLPGRHRHRAGRLRPAGASRAALARADRAGLRPRRRARPGR